MEDQFELLERRNNEDVLYTRRRKAVYVYLGKSAADKEDPEVGKLLALASVLHNPEDLHESHVNDKKETFLRHCKQARFETETIKELLEKV